MIDILIIDGSGFAHRAQGVLHLNTEGGENTSIIFGVLNMIRSFISKHDFREVCVTWDGKKYKEAKWKVYPEYKTNRNHNFDGDSLKFHVEIQRQIKELQKILPALGIKQLRRDYLEADDIIGLLCEGLTGKKILIVSGDQDLFQLVSEDVTVYYPYKELFLKQDNFEQEVGVSQENFIFYKTIVGDSGDNISGLKGFGEVTAKKLLKAFGPWTGWFTEGSYSGWPVHKPKEEVLQSLRENQKQVLLEEIPGSYDSKALEILVRNYSLMKVGFLDEESSDDLMGDYHNQIPLFDEELVKSYFLEKQFGSLTKRFNAWINPFLMLCNRGMKQEIQFSDK